MTDEIPWPDPPAGDAWAPGTADPSGPATPPAPLPAGVPANGGPPPPPPPPGPVAGGPPAGWAAAGPATPAPVGPDPGAPATGPAWAPSSPAGPPGYGPPAGYGPPSGYGPPAGYGPPSGFGPPPGPGFGPGHGPAGPPPGAAPSGGRPRLPRAPRWVLGLSALIVLTVFAGGLYVVTSGKDSHPSEWDPRVSSIASWVAAERGLEFDHPVTVNFLDEAAYTEASTGGETVDDPEAEQELEDALGMLRALGLVEGDVDLSAAGDALNDSGTLAYYSPETEMVYVRGTELTPALRVTIAHELVHVLQDQNFDLERIAELSDGEAATLRAVAEGDAGRIEDRYASEELTDEEYDEYIADSTSASEEAEAALDGTVPEIMTALFAAPYVFGPELVAYLEEEGDDAIDEALRSPVSEEVLFNPLVHGTPAAEPREVSVDTPSGADEIETGEFGSTAWYLMLAARLEPSVALAATDGLGGDAYSTYRQDDRVCVQIQAVGDSPAELDELRAAVDDWAAAGPAGAATVTGDDELTVTSCDPGADATGLGTVSFELLVLPVTRTQLFGAMLAQGLDRDQATCAANSIVAELTVEQLMADEEDPALGRLVQDVMAGCS